MKSRNLKINIMSKIEWTQETWNPIVGCSKISPGCENCYAEKMAYRLAHALASNDTSDTWSAYVDVIGIGQKKNGVIQLAPKWSGQTSMVKSAFEKPCHWKKPRMIFVCSMGDLFHESVPFEWIDTVFGVIGMHDHHTYQILTKRPERMVEYFESRGFNEKFAEGYPHVWIGVTAENQEQANKRIPILLDIPAAKRFVSIEPMLSKIELSDIIESDGSHYVNYLTGEQSGVDGEGTYCDWHPNKIDWVILGGETGHKARPMHLDWVRSVRDQCKEAGVPFFFKQWGEYKEVSLTPEQRIKEKYIVLGNDGKEYIIAGEHLSPVYMQKVGKKKAGNELDGKAYQEFPKTEQS